MPIHARASSASASVIRPSILLPILNWLVVALARSGSQLPEERSSSRQSTLVGIGEAEVTALHRVAGTGKRSLTASSLWTFLEGEEWPERESEGARYDPG